MITLAILKKDGSNYWTERFNDLPAAQKWLAEEQTRPYWDKSYSASFVDDTPAPPSAAEVAAAKAKADAQQLLAASDYIVIKLAEGMALGTDVKHLIQKYDKQLKDRAAARLIINPAGD